MKVVCVSVMTNATKRLLDNILFMRHNIWVSQKGRKKNVRARSYETQS